MNESLRMTLKDKNNIIKRLTKQIKFLESKTPESNLRQKMFDLNKEIQNSNKRIINYSRNEWNFKKKLISSENSNEKNKNEILRLKERIAVIFKSNKSQSEENKKRILDYYQKSLNDLKILLLKVTIILNREV